jgi:metal-responsive CopG/Arc/MetJ family transcriptional regulator
MPKQKEVHVKKRVRVEVQMPYWLFDKLDYMAHIFEMSRSAVIRGLIEKEKVF